jgi:hypothetical protein
VCILLVLLLYYIDWYYLIQVIQDHSLFLVCPDSLVAVGETSYGIRVWFIGSIHSLHYLFIYLFVYICSVKSTLVYLIR